MMPKTQLLLYSALMALIIISAYFRLIPTKLPIPLYDSIGHFVLYGLWGYFFGNAFPESLLRSEQRYLPVGVIFATLIAIIEEMLQHLSPARSFSIYDLLSGLLGVLTSLIILNVVRKKRSRLL
jgi:polysaccharide biosynthesis protein VpsQ